MAQLEIVQIITDSEWHTRFKTTIQSNRITLPSLKKMFLMENIQYIDHKCAKPIPWETHPHHSSPRPGGESQLLT